MKTRYWKALFSDGWLICARWDSSGCLTVAYKSAQYKDGKLVDRFDAITDGGLNPSIRRIMAPGPEDTFELSRRVYEINKGEFKAMLRAKKGVSVAWSSHPIAPK